MCTIHRDTLDIIPVSSSTYNHKKHIGMFRTLTAALAFRRYLQAQVLS